MHHLRDDGRYEWEEEGGGRRKEEGGPLQNTSDPIFSIQFRHIEKTSENFTEPVPINFFLQLEPSVNITLASLHKIFGVTGLHKSSGNFFSNPNFISFFWFLSFRRLRIFPEFTIFWLQIS
jgi:hypothetical protein